MKRGYGWVKFPNTWRKQLRTVKARGTTYHVATVILDKARWAEWVTLPNKGLSMHRQTKSIALKQLRAAGLIIVQERGHKSPLIKPMFRE